MKTGDFIPIIINPTDKSINTLHNLRALPGLIALIIALISFTTDNDIFKIVTLILMGFGLVLLFIPVIFSGKISINKSQITLKGNGQLISVQKDNIININFELFEEGTHKNYILMIIKTPDNIFQVGISRRLFLNKYHRYVQLFGLLIENSYKPFLDKRLIDSFPSFRVLWEDYYYTKR